MKTLRKFTRVASWALIGVVGLMASCQDDEKRLTVQDTQDISEEAQTDAYYQDLDDMGSAAMGDQNIESGRTAAGSGVITISDDRFCGTVTVVYDNTTPNTPKGVITVDFGTTGCADKRGNIRTGKLIFTYSGKRFQPGSTVITTAENYTINAIKIEGVRTSTNVTGSTESAPKFNVKLENGKATFPDGSAATRVSNITWSWIRNVNPLLDELIIDASSTASGTTRGGRSYVVSLLEALKYQRTCWIAVDGVKRYVLDNGKEIVIDYGVGDCNSISVTVNGVTRNVQVSK